MENKPRLTPEEALAKSAENQLWIFYQDTQKAIDEQPELAKPLIQNSFVGRARTISLVGASDKTKQEFEYNLLKKTQELCTANGVNISEIDLVLNDSLDRGNMGEKNLKEGRLQIYQDMENEYFQALKKAEKNGSVYFTVEDDEFDTFEEAKSYAEEIGANEIEVSSFAICYGAYCDNEYDEYNKAVLDLDGRIIRFTESLKNKKPMKENRGNKMSRKKTVMEAVDEVGKDKNVTGQDVPMGCGKAGDMCDCVHAEVDVAFADAVNQDKDNRKKMGKMWKDMEKDAKDITPKDPDAPIKEKNMFTEKLTLDESLFEAVEDEPKKAFGKNARKKLGESSKRDDIDAERDNRVERARARFDKVRDDADAQRDDRLKKQHRLITKGLRETFEPISSFNKFAFLDKTAQDWEVKQLYRDLDDDRLHAIVYRPKQNDYLVALGYSADDGTWNQGRYDYQSLEDAVARLKRDYDVEKVRIVDGKIAESLRAKQKVKSTKKKLGESFEDKRAYFTDGKDVLCVDSKDKVFTTMSMSKTFERPDVKKVDSDTLGEIRRTYIQAGWQDNWYGGSFGKIKESCKGKKGLKESKRTLKEKVADEAYDVADIVLDKIEETGDDIIDWSTFDDFFYDAVDEVFGAGVGNSTAESDEKTLPNGDDLYDFIEDVRGILGYSGWATIFAGDYEGGLTTRELDDDGDIKPREFTDNQVIYRALKYYYDYGYNDYESDDTNEEDVLYDLVQEYSQYELTESCKSKKKADKKVKEITESLIAEVKKQFPDFNGKIKFDNSRAQSLYVEGKDLGLPVNKFGAYKDCDECGVKDEIKHNGREDDKTVELGEKFVEALQKLTAVKPNKKSVNESEKSKAYNTLLKENRPAKADKKVNESITIKMDEEDFLDLLMDRVESWNDSSNDVVYRLYQDMYESYVYDGVFENTDASIAEIVDNDWVNYCTVVEPGDDSYDKILELYERDGLGDISTEDAGYSYIEAVEESDGAKYFLCRA